MTNFNEIKPTELTDNVFKLIGTDWMLVTATANNKTNTMTASWGGAGIMWGKNVAYIVIRPQRYTKEFIDNSDHFSLSFFDKEFKKQLTYLGTVSGRDEDKIKNSSLTLKTKDSTPYFEEANIVLLCKKLFAQPMEEKSFLDQSILEKWYPNKDYHELYIAEIEHVLIK